MWKCSNVVYTIYTAIVQSVVSPLTNFLGRGEDIELITIYIITYYCLHNIAGQKTVPIDPR